MDLSAPEGSSVNDGIARDLCSTSYLAMDEVIACIVRLGKESLIAKDGYQASVSKRSNSPR